MTIVASKRPALCLLRIGFAVGCGAACLLLLARWLLNYWRDDTVFVYDPRLWRPTLDAPPSAT